MWKSKWGYVCVFIALFVIACATVGVVSCTSEVGPLQMETVNGVTYVYRVVDGGVMMGRGELREGESPEAAISTNTSGVLHIPTTLGGLPVVRLGDGAFAECNGLAEVVVPSSVHTVCHGTFKNCRGLTALTISESVTNSCGCEIVSFTKCDNLTELTLTGGAGTIRKRLLCGNTNVTSIVVGEGVRSIEHMAFALCSRLGSVTLPQSLKRIGTLAFYEDSRLTSVAIPAGVENVASNAFMRCDNLSSITVDSSNATYSAVDGMLLDRADARLVFYTPGRLGKCTIPDGVTSIGANAFEGHSGLTEVVMPESVKEIGKEAFAYCSGLTSVTFSSKIDTIETEAFRACGNLSSITIPKGVTTIRASAFAWCENLTTVEIPASVTNIHKRAFNGCFKIASVVVPVCATNLQETFPDSYQTITNVTVWQERQAVIRGARIVSCCGGLNDRTPVVLPTETVDGVTYSYSISNGVATIGFPRQVRGQVAYRIPAICTNTPGVLRVPSVLGGCPVRKIEGGAFINCHELTSIVLPGSVREVGMLAFAGCTNLTSVVIGEGVETVGYVAFDYCPKLKTVVFPATLTNLFRRAFDRCPSLEAIYVNPESRSYASVNGVLFSKDGTRLIKCPATKQGTYVVPGGVKVIEYDAFSECKGLSDISIPASVEQIEDWSFNGCRNVTVVTIDPNTPHYSLINGIVFDKAISRLFYYPEEKQGAYSIPDSVSSIEKDAFWRCSGLTEVIIPPSVKDIKPWAFYGCEGLARVVIPTSVTNIGEHAFGGCDNITSVVIPQQMLLNKVFPDSYAKITNVVRCARSWE